MLPRQTANTSSRRFGLNNNNLLIQQLLTGVFTVNQTLFCVLRPQERQTDVTLPSQGSCEGRGQSLKTSLIHVLWWAVVVSRVKPVVWKAGQPGAECNV